MPSFLTPDFGLMFWLLVAFSVLFVVLAKYGFPAILNHVEERKLYIDESLAKAKEAHEKLKTIQAESERIIKEAQAQQDKILKEALAVQKDLVEQAKQKAVEEGEKIIKEAQQQILIEKENALRGIRSQVATYAVLIAEKVMQKDLESTQSQTALIEKLLDELKLK